MLDGPPEDAVAELGDDEAAQEQTEEELEMLLYSAREREAAQKLTLPTWWKPTFQLHLDIQMQYNLTAPRWEGEGNPAVTPQSQSLNKQSRPWVHM